MANNRPYVQHIKSRTVESDGKPKLPSSEILEYGEIAVNYHAGVETLSIKNDLGGIATFQDEVEITSGTPKPNTEIWIDTSEDIPIEVYTKEQVDAIVDVLNDKNAEQDSDISELSGKTGELDGKIDELEAKDAELTELAENAYEVQIGTSADTISANTKVFIDTEGDAGISLYTKEQIDEQVNVLQDGIASANEVQVGASGDTISANTKVFIDTDADSSVTLYTKEQIDEQVSVLQDEIKLANEVQVGASGDTISANTKVFIDTDADSSVTLYTKEQIDEQVNVLQDGIVSANEVQVGASGDTISANTKVFIDTDADSSVRLYTKEQIDEQIGHLTDVLSAHTANSNVHVTLQDKENWNNKQDISGMTAYTMTAVTYALSTIVSNHTGNTDIHVTLEDKENWNNKSEFSGDYDDLTNKPTIPTVPTSNTAFTNDAGYITDAALTNYALKSEIPDISGKEDKMGIVMFDTEQSAYTMSLGSYNLISTPVGTATFNLPTVSSATTLQGFVTSFMTSSSPNITFPNGSNVYYNEGTDIFVLESDTLYEMNAIYDGIKWKITLTKFVIPS